MFYVSMFRKLSSERNVVDASASENIAPDPTGVFHKAPGPYPSVFNIDAWPELFSVEVFHRHWLCRATNSLIITPVA